MRVDSCFFVIRIFTAMLIVARNGYRHNPGALNTRLRFYFLQQRFSRFGFSTFPTPGPFSGISPQKTRPAARRYRP
jgi:hypothetical protein